MKALNKAIENAQVDYVFKQLAASGLPHALAVTITAGMIWWDIKGWAIVLWFVALQTSHVMRIYILDSIWKSNSEQGDYRVVKPFLVAGMVATGIVWSLVPGFFMEGVHQSLLGVLILFCLPCPVFRRSTRRIGFRRIVKKA